MPINKKQQTWGGRFSETPTDRVRRYTESVSYDARLYAEDIRGSLAHAGMLKRMGVLTVAELDSIRKHLQAIQTEIESGRFQWNMELEDVHMNIEAELTRRTPAGAKLHTGRSRNDQVATDMRLWLKTEINRQQKALYRLQSALISWAEKNEEVLIPGYTHLQRAQPVLFAHHVLAYVEMLGRDDERLAEVWHRTNVSPLGAGAIAGSTLPLDREWVAHELGFIDKNGHPRVATNSMDAISDRDFMVEYLAAASLIAVHISRLAEDLILWSSAEFNFVRIGDAFTTGSSLMPQKKNPDIAELARGKTGGVIGDLVALLMTLKGLPMTYNRDLQEDKKRLFHACDTVRETLEIFADMMAHVKVNRFACAAAVADPLLLATDLADALVKQGIPFRKAHHLVGQAVALAEKENKTLREFKDEDWQKIDPILVKVAGLLKEPLSKRLKDRKVLGAPQPEQVNRELARWKKILKTKNIKN